MKIMLLGSFSFAEQLFEMKNKVKEMGFEVLTTSNLEENINSPEIKISFEDELKHCLETDTLREGFNFIESSDAVLVCNYDKNQIKGYIGTAVLMEIAIAYHLKKKIFLLNNFDMNQKYAMELSIINPTIISNDLFKII